MMLSLKEWALRENIGIDRARQLIHQKRVPGAVFDGRRWMVPASARHIRQQGGVKYPNGGVK